MKRSGVLPAERDRKRLIRSPSPTSEHYGKDPKTRSVEELLRCGMVIVDKPSGPSSHQVAAWLRDALDVAHVGHGGTLDPRVTGVLPVTIAGGTKVASAMLEAGKEYTAVLRLHQERSAHDIERIAKEFTGKIKQMPPVRSAVARRPRIRRIYYLDIVEINGKDVLFRAGCQAGTYIRTLCVDMGKALGTRGHMQELRRTRTGILVEGQSKSMTEIRDALEIYRETQDASWLKGILRPIEDMVGHLDKIVIRDSAVEAICHGAPLAVQGIVELDAGIEENTRVAIMTQKGELVATGKSLMTSHQMIENKDGLAALPEAVVLPKGTYPRVWKRK